MNIFEMLPKGSLNKMPQDKMESLINDAGGKQKQQNMRKSKMNLVLYVVTFLLLAWGVFMMLSSSQLDFRLFLILCVLVFVIFVGSRMIINGQGDMLTRDSSHFGAWKHSSLSGLGAKVYGAILLILGLIGYIIFFMPFALLANYFG